jgi:hypothetical protein
MRFRTALYKTAQTNLNLQFAVEYAQHVIGLSCAGHCPPRDQLCGELLEIIGE